MQVIAEQRYIRTSPRKLRLVVDSVKHLSPQASLVQLENMDKRAALPVKKAIKQALANAANNFNLDVTSLRFAKVEINKGPTFKRFRAVSRGRAHSIYKYSSHIKVVLETKPRPVTAPVTSKAAAAKAPEAVKADVVTKKPAKTTAKKPSTRQTKAKAKEKSL